MFTIEFIKQYKSLFLEEGNNVLFGIIRKIKKDEKGVIIFGAGEIGKRAEKVLSENGIVVNFFVDNLSSKWNTKLNGKDIFNPEILCNHLEATVIICCWDFENIINQLFLLGVKNIETNFYIYLLALHNRNFFYENLDEAIALQKDLSDEVSKDVLRSLILHALNFDGSLLRAIHFSGQYFFDKSFDIRAGDCIIDAGAYDGDTVADILNRFGTVFDEIHCFEPNKYNYKRLLRFIDQKHLSSLVLPYEMALSDNNGVSYFSGHSLGYHLNAASEDNETAIKTGTIDELFKNKRVDFIKIDIEGAEPLALRGAIEVIKRDHPRLAICVYHEPSHMFEIPKFIRSIVPEYRLYLRHHTSGLYETVLYAII